MDVAEAHAQIFEQIIQRESLNINLNLGTGKGTSVLNLLRTFEKTNNIKIPHIFSCRRPGDFAYVVADNSYALSDFKISPKRTIQDMCQDGWKWMQLNPKGY